MYPINEQDLHRIQQRANLYRSHYPAFARWAKGYGVIRHTDETQVRVFDLCQQLLCHGRYARFEDIVAILCAADRLASASMWLVTHMTYARNVYLDGHELNNEDFKENPQGHTGGSLNMVPGYVGYLAANVLAGHTRSWLMGQGHCVAAIDAVNVLLGNVYKEQEERYSLNEQGLSRLVRDFYGYATDEDGRPEAPLGSHVSPHTAGGLIEGGYLGFAELQYVHMPLPGERLVAFISDGAFEEQRGSDWAPRWWRAEDCGLVTPVMIANGRRIDQRSIMYQQGGLEWFYNHLQHNGFSPITIDGRDPAAFIWGIFESENRLSACAEQIASDQMHYPVRLPYLIAETVKGYGFYGAGTNASHGTPLPANPRYDAKSRTYFNQYAQQLYVPKIELDLAISAFLTHDIDLRVREKDHALTQRNPHINEVPKAGWLQVGKLESPMIAVDREVRALLEANPELRPRLGNPDELRSNLMNLTLDYLNHRVLTPEKGVAESIHGGVITALNEEAVVSAALANKGGINLVVSYEAFAVKMLGALRQEIIFVRHQKVLNRQPQWLSVPVIVTSHLWENGKNEQSHQDPTFGEAFLGEMSDTSRAIYPGDSNTAIACIRECYRTRGQIWALTIPKQSLETFFTPEQTKMLLQYGAFTLFGEGDIQLVAVGAYQLRVCFEVHQRLSAAGVKSCVTYMIEPGRFRNARDSLESSFIVDDVTRENLFPPDIALRVFVAHMRPETLAGICRPLDLGISKTLYFGFINHGGTLDTQGLLKANHSDTDSVHTAICQRLLRNEPRQ
ncbi:MULTISPECIES: phosphoketolase family protein [Kangiella]|uniref:D-xylulose 5-phosphate/D-fructose 6-phosphate phosphoketolase n=1 Tax=Kangiella koreensis (strain DSM 16069 / JCM 12317 / KCTC 12182 / SW-125) TaxID=523791 RepID=C7RBU0_KANKD|nr:hypothetical protein [Kangiella koreensis]ACV26732.1 D-xylulose 5-phosphate/D-fructose 6-phosphate phosphoketolase [Kangiella koreensis DSM 16069]